MNNDGKNISNFFVKIFPFFIALVFVLVKLIMKNTCLLDGGWIVGGTYFSIKK